MSKVLELPPPDATRLDEAQAKRVLTITGGLAAVGVAISAVAAFADTHRFAFSY